MTRASRGSGRIGALTRTLRLMRTLEQTRAPKTWEELATRLECAPRTVRRDIAALTEAGAHVAMARAVGVAGEPLLIGPLTWPSGREPRA